MNERIVPGLGRRKSVLWPWLLLPAPTCLRLFSRELRPGSSGPPPATADQEGASSFVIDTCRKLLCFNNIQGCRKPLLWHSHLTKGIFAKNQAQVETTCVKELHTQARICCNSKAACIGYTIGPNWACPGISVSQSEENFTNEKVTFYKPLYVYTLCEPIGGVV